MDDCQNRALRLRLEPGTILAGRYELVQHLGIGGMGFVFRARQLDLDNTVAVKVLHEAAQGDEIAVRRLQREAQLIASLDHPNIPKVHTIASDDGVMFIVMEYINGEPLGAILRQRKRLPLSEALPMFVQLASAAAHAHNQGIVHRDIKPGNIIIVASEGGAKAYLVDFGIAKKLESSQKVTQTGAIVGTARYLSPEQANGAPVDERTDIYSLACVLYETISGRPLYDSESPYELMLKHSAETLPPMDGPEFGRIGPVLAKALAKDPADRFENMQAFSEALLNPGSAAALLSKDKKRARRTPVALGLGLVLLSAVTAYGAQYFLRQDNSGIKADQRPINHENITTSIKTLELAVDVDPIEITPEVEAAVKVLSDPAVAMTNQQARKALLYAGRIEDERGNYAKADALWERVILVSKKDQGASPFDAARTIARRLSVRGKSQQAIKFLEQTVADDVKWQRLHNSHGTKALLANYYGNYNRQADAIRIYDELINTPGGDQSFKARTFGRLGKAEFLVDRNPRLARKLVHDWQEDIKNDFSIERLGTVYSPRATRILGRCEAAERHNRAARALYAKAIEDSERVEAQLKGVQGDLARWMVQTVVSQKTYAKRDLGLLALSENHFAAARKLADEAYDIAKGSDQDAKLEIKAFQQDLRARFQSK